MRRPNVIGHLTTFSTAIILSLPPTLKYEAGVIVAGGDFAMVHGRFSGFGAPVNWIAADIVRLQDGMLIEHWDVIQDEATQDQSKSGLPMFGDKFPQLLVMSATAETHVSRRQILLV